MQFYKHKKTALVSNDNTDTGGKYEKCAKSDLQFVSSTSHKE